MSNANTGGPAFPESGPRGQASGGEGMTLRDYFAAKAVQGLMGRAWADSKTGKFPENLHGVWATAAYQIADAMLKARES